MLSKPNILVSTNFNTFSELAVRAGDRIRNKTSGCLHVIHVADLDFSGTPDKRNELLNVELTEHVRRCGIEAKTILKSGSPEGILLKEIEQLKIDLLILTYKENKELTQKIIAVSPIPVLVLKTLFKLDRVAALVAPDGPIEEVVSAAEEFSLLFPSKLLIVSLFPKSSSSNFVHDVKERCKKTLGLLSSAAMRIEATNELRVAHHLDSILDEELVDLAVVKKHHSKHGLRAILGSETKRLIDLYQGNILVLPETKA